MESISLLWDINSWGPVTRGFVFVIWAIAGAVLAFELFYLVKWLLAFRKGVAAKSIANHLKIYEATFLKGLGDGRKTTEHAIEILPMTTLQPGVALTRSMPNMLIGIGILGTFVGLSIGVLGLQNQGSAEEIQQGIQGLLQSMSTAFVTSVYGMAGSLILNFFIRLFSDIEGRQHVKFCNALDNEHYLGEAEYDRWQRDEMKRMLLETFGQRVDGAMVSPGFMLHQTERHGAQTVSKLDSFSADLAEGLMLSSETIDALQDKLGSAFSSMLSHRGKPVFEQMAESLEAIQNKDQQDSANIVDGLKGTLEEMMNSFKGELSQGATQQIEALSGVMGATVSSLTQMPDVIQQSQAKFETMLFKMEDLGEGMMNRVQEAFANANQKAVEAQMTLINESNQASQAIRQAQEEVGTQMVNSVQTITSSQQVTAEALSQVLERVSEIMRESEASQEGMKKQIGLLLQAGDALGGAVQTMKSASTEVGLSASRLGTASSDLKSSLESNRDQQAAMEQSLRQQFESVGAMLQDYEGRFMRINEGMSEAFEGLNKGIRNYESTANEAINSHLTTFTNSLSGAATSLNSSFQALQEIVSVLDDALDSIRKS